MSYYGSYGTASTYEEKDKPSPLLYEAVFIGSIVAFSTQPSEKKFYIGLVNGVNANEGKVEICTAGSSEVNRYEVPISDIRPLFVEESEWDNATNIPYKAGKIIGHEYCSKKLSDEILHGNATGTFEQNIGQKEFKKLLSFLRESKLNFIYVSRTKK